MKKNSDGVIISYGNTAITYKRPVSRARHAGRCPLPTELRVVPRHAGQWRARQRHERWPTRTSSVSAPATIDFWVDSGRMPAANPRSVEAARRVPRLDPDQALAIASWVNSLSPSYPYIPDPNLKIAKVSQGAALFALNCASCHTIEGDGDALAFSTFSPSLRHVPAFQVAEAIRTGPGNMPRFTGNLSDYQVKRHCEVRDDRDSAPRQSRWFRTRWTRSRRGRFRRTGARCGRAGPSWAFG